MYFLLRLHIRIEKLFLFALNFLLFLLDLGNFCLMKLEIPILVGGEAIIYLVDQIKIKRSSLHELRHNICWVALRFLLLAEYALCLNYFGHLFSQH